MACTFNLIDQLGGSPDAGGTWSETTSGTTYTGQGGTITNGDQGTIDVTGITPGVYTFQYAVGACTDLSEVTVTVVEGADAGADSSTSECSNNNTLINIFDLISPADTNGSWSGNMTTSGGYSANTGAPTDDTFNPSLVPPGTYTAVYTVDNSDPSTPAGCDNCIDTATVTIIVETAGDAGNNSAITVCN